MAGSSSAHKRERTDAGRGWRLFAIAASEPADRLEDPEAESWDGVLNDPGLPGRSLPEESGTAACEFRETSRFGGWGSAPEPVGPRSAGAGLEAGSVADSGISMPSAGVGRPGLAGRVVVMGLRSGFGRVPAGSEATGPRDTRDREGFDSGPEASPSANRIAEAGTPVGWVGTGSEADVTFPSDREARRSKGFATEVSGVEEAGESSGRDAAASGFVGSPVVTTSAEGVGGRGPHGAGTGTARPKATRDGSGASAVVATGRRGPVRGLSGEGAGSRVSAVPGKADAPDASTPALTRGLEARRSARAECGFWVESDREPGGTGTAVGTGPAGNGAASWTTGIATAVTADGGEATGPWPEPREPSSSRPKSAPTANPPSAGTGTVAGKALTASCGEMREKASVPGRLDEVISWRCFASGGDDG